MSKGANLSVMDQRAAARHSVDFVVIGEHRSLGDIKAHIVNVSANGFMTEGDMPLQKGERLSLRLPVAGMIEAHLIWSLGGRSGFQFERILRPNDFIDMVEAMQPRATVRKYR
ncbi:PilZ domain-containing protein [Alterisphingorhabdus coralli]|uniref:PilZ domain-containing protein n=1 Tax=Alterisphingorhabdus coralli TaxID=3071408 RepID=A0AA97F7U1_9SPHN|nr:PilZ domain-containing protein [Parasphingorhabdus sp. SCSIO 66989]WOE74110.1 PilZ domain-containing protein [Parasphingorhabdus sp. SCSIO 66989]